MIEFDLRVDVSRRYFQSLLKKADGIRRAPILNAIIVDCGLARLNSQRLFEIADRLVRPSGLNIDVAKVVVSVRVSGY